MAEIPDWFNDAILDGLQRIYSLSLPRTPAAELYPATILTWIDALAHGMKWEQERDAARIHAAFRVLERSRVEWPSPKHFLEALPPVNTPRLTHEYRPLSREQAQARIDAINAELRKREPRHAD